MSELTRELPSIQTLKEMFTYNQETGDLVWKTRPEHHFSNRRQMMAINARRSGTICGNVRSRGGYVFIGITLNGKGRATYTAHRIIWKMVHGTEPSSIDHINGVKTDNRLCNLRAVSHSENMKNMRLYRTNKSGAAGVYRPPGAKSWQAFIKHNGKRIHLGSFQTFDDARDARARAAIKYGYHPNHGTPLTFLPEPK